MSSVDTVVHIIPVVTTHYSPAVYSPEKTLTSPEKTLTYPVCVREGGLKNVSTLVAVLERPWK